ncbi:exodeoxyribonuclease VII small subunit [Candidatus Parcubacteria bacterium]|nr:MAG: exodeoxyribonuclease VII small subunit [Candidatus Parcubacteria bacterium]
MQREKEHLTQALTKLEKIVEELGKNDLDVEEGLRKFKEGVKLIKFCREKLRKAENEFILLKKELEEDE